MNKLPKLIEAKHTGDYRIRVRFDDGVEGEINLYSELWGEVFEPLKNPDVFARLRLDPEIETVVWPNGADFAPEFLYRKLCPGYVLKSEVTDDAA